MGNDINFSTFPNGTTQALTMLYLQNQDLKDKTPEEIHTLYWQTYYKIQHDYKNKRQEDFFSKL